jgi:hypothetical protein
MGNTLSNPSLVSTQQDLPTLLLDIPAYLHHSVLGGQSHNAGRLCCCCLLPSACLMGLLMLGKGYWGVAALLEVAVP